MHIDNQNLKSSIYYVLGGLFFLLAPFYLPEYARILLVSILITSIYVASMNILSGYLGLVTLGHAMFWGTGGYVVGILTTRGIVENFFVVIIIGFLATGLLGAILGLIVVRMVRVYFLIITLALGQVAFSIAAYSLANITGGTDGLGGLARPYLGFAFSINDTNFYYLVLLVTAVNFLFMYMLRRSPFGHVLIGIRDNERRMSAMGYNVFIYKYTSFIIAGVMSGIGGMMYAYCDRFMSPTELGFGWSGAGLIMLFIGGIGTTFGPLVGATVYTLLRYFVSVYTMYWSMISGIIFITVVLFFRGGMVSYISLLLRRKRVGSFESRKIR